MPVAEQIGVAADATIRRLAVRAAAGELFSSSLDYEETLQHVARLAVPALGDLCIVDVMEDGAMRRVAIAHTLPEKAELLDELRRRYPPSEDSPQPAGRVIRTGEPELLAEVTPSVVASHSRNAEHAALILAIGIRSHLAVPLVARGAIVGVISVGITESDRQYTSDDLAFVQDVARLAALAVDNARLYRRAQDELAERQRAESALRRSESRVRASEERLRLALTAARMNVWDWDVISDRVECSDNAREFWGIDVGSAADFMAVIHPEDRAAVDDAGGCAQEGQPYRAEYRVIGTDRQVRWMQSRGRVEPGPDGRPMRILGVTVDITDLKLAEETTRLLADTGEALNASLDYHVTLRNLARIVVPRLADWCAVDLLTEAGTLERVSVNHPDPTRVEVARQLFEQYPPRRLDPVGAWRVLTSSQPEWAAAITDEMLQAVSHDPEHLAQLRSLQLRSYICVPLVARGVPIGVLTLVHAESGRRYRESDVELAMDLARRAATAVDNARLFQRLRLEDRRKDEFLATLAHELRNPLAPIRTGVAMLGPDLARDASERVRQVIERQLAHMVRLIDELLDLSRVTRDKERLEREHVDLVSVVTLALEASRPLIEDAGLQLDVQLPAAPVILHADRTRLAQILSNLLNNAAKYTEPGGRVDVSAAAENGELEIRVRDTGVGIPREMLGQIFEMFAQVGRPFTRSQSGLGIGLTLVRRLVELHGGRVWAESDGEGKGSTFVVRLPVAAGNPERPDARAEQTRSGRPRPARRVLVVDDNLDAAEMLAELLKLDGHDVRTATSGAAALELVTEFLPDVALLDIGLPGMNGYELARRLREQPQLRPLVLVAVTGWGQHEDRRLSKEAGFDHHLTKPVDPDDVRRLVAEAG